MIDEEWAITCRPHGGIAPNHYTCERCKQDKEDNMIQPTRDNLTIRPIDPAKHSPGGITLPEGMKGPPRGEVIAVGPGVIRDGTLQTLDGLDPGMVVILRKHGIEVRKGVNLVNWQDVLAIDTEAS